MNTDSAIGADPSTVSIKDTISSLRTSPKNWLVTGVAGFIGSNLLETLLNNGQRVVGIDNLETGFQHNLDSVQAHVGESAWSNFSFVNGDIRNPDDCARVCKDVDIVMHQAALGSVPRSINNPARTNSTNIDGFLNMLIATSEAGINRFVYAASSSTYGDHPALPKVESVIGAPLSPYAVTKYVNELYADVFARHYGIQTIGLRYFNVFGPRQSPDGAYAAVIPRWVDAMLNGNQIAINGDGTTSRDFCFIDNVIQANLLAATAPDESTNEVYNVALNDQTSLKELAELIANKLIARKPEIKIPPATHKDFRAGDVKHSRADISKAKSMLGYRPTHNVSQGLDVAIDWYLTHNT